ncbi:hypothetical protein MKR81_27345 (plasmid) [Vibrio campbellii]|uniref:hypothetical protein n=1 Tax=Vibrio campbellii TaxID=680 RepID=UPI001F072842|nr:hypothetical protein [Vibrio campbellii]UMM06666.1 hypothetical protein MKR81_27345 [Vibrio campbellii]
MTITTSKTPRLKGNTPTAILGWFKELNRLDAMFHPDDGSDDMFLKGTYAFTSEGAKFIKEDMYFARELCKSFRTCIYTIGMVAADSKPFIAVYQGRDGFGYSTITQNKGEVDCKTGFETREAAYNALKDEMKSALEDYFVADVCHVGLWFEKLSKEHKIPVIEQAVIGDFGSIFCSHLDEIETKRIRENESNTEKGGEAMDTFTCMLSGFAIKNPYKTDCERFSVPAATEYGYDYVQWYKRGCEIL